MRAHSLKDIIDLDKWQEVQEDFSGAMGVPVSTVNPDGYCITKPSGQLRTFQELLTVYPGFQDDFFSYPPRFINKIRSVRSRQDRMESSLRLNLFSVPIITDSGPAGYVLVGPVILGIRDLQFYANKADALGIDKEILLDSLREVRVLSVSVISSFLKLIEDTLSCFIQLGYARIKLKSLVSADTDPVRENNENYTDNILNALLDVSSEILRADLGSVMLLDREKEELSLRIYRGAVPSMAESSCLKLGQGIAGLAAERQKTILINGDTEDRVVKDRMARPELKSSVVVPIKCRDDVFAVLNLASQKEEARFSPGDLDMLRALIDFAESAISSLPSG